MLKTKSVYTRVEKSDGLRILVTRFRGRGLPNNRYHVWMANLGPSEQMLKRFQNGEITWAAFSRSYTKEIFSTSEVDRGNRTIKNHGQKFTLRLIRELARRGTVTLMCHCAEDQQQCHRHLLKKLLLSKKI